MAPEFFPFIAFIGLAVIALGGLVTCLVLLVWAHFSTRLRKVLRVLSAVAFSGVVVVALALVVLGVKIRQQYFLNEPLVSACGDGDLAEAQRLLSRGASPDAYGVDFRETALIAASESGHTEIVALLLRRGAHTDLQDTAGKTALQRAKAAGHTIIVSMLERPGEAMKSGYDNYSGIWGNPYYDDEAAPLRNMHFSRRVFSKAPALVAIHAKDGWREEREYKGNPFDPQEWRLVANRWDHQHCCVCRFKITEGMTYWSTEEERQILCDACHEHYME